MYKDNRRNPIQTVATGLWAILTFCFALSGHAAVVIEGTRIVYDEGQREVNVKLVNVDEQKSTLVQLWVDDDNIEATPNSSAVPFLLNPPLAKIGAGKKQQVRLIYIGENENYAQEKLFWFNVLEVPPKSTDPASLSFAVRTRIKLFYRPKSMARVAPNAAESTVWRWTSTQEPFEIEAHNTSKFHLSMPTVRLEGAASNIEISNSRMIAPNERAKFKVEGLPVPPDSSMKIRHSALNDYGAEVFYTKQILDGK